MLLFASIGSSLFAEEIIDLDAAASQGNWLLKNAVLGISSGKPELSIKTTTNPAKPDLYLSFDEDKPADMAGGWSVAVKGQYYKGQEARFGSGSASFRAPLSGLTLTPGSSAAFAPNNPIRDLSLEFWLKPARADSGEIVFLWKASRQTGRATLAQQISCLVMNGKLVFGFIDFFAPANGSSFTISLHGRKNLIPGSWSHHLVRFDAGTGLLEYLMDGEVEATAYATSSGRQAGDVYTPIPGSSGRLELAHNYTGLIDEFLIAPEFIEEPLLRPYAAEGGIALSPILDLGHSNSSITGINVRVRQPGESVIHWSYRSGDSAAGWTESYPEWTAFKPGPLNTPGKGRYMQIRMELYPDAKRENSPSFYSLAVSYEPDRAPGAPQGLSAIAGDKRITVRWKKNSEADITGYLVYYGGSQGEYFGTGAKEGPSPIIVPDRNASSLVLSGLNNGTLYFISVAAYDQADPPHIGDLAREVSVRPQRNSP